MRAICVDDELLSVEITVEQCRQLPQIDEASGFTSALEALKELKEHPADIALLDIDMPGMNGLTLAAEMKKICPKIIILFLTAFKEFAYDAYKLHASGYLLKPVLQEELADEVSHALSMKVGEQSEVHITVQTFNGFDVFVNGEKVLFKRSKSKELLAYLVDRRGNAVRRAVISSVLWENAIYDYSMQKQLDVIIRSLRSTLNEYGVSDMMKMQAGELWIIPDRLECDMYRFLDGDTAAIAAYHGEYMSDYSWASQMEGYLDQIKNG